MGTVSVNTAELSGYALDWAMAVTQGYKTDTKDAASFLSLRLRDQHNWSSNWNKVGPLMRTYGVSLRALWNDGVRRTGEDACRADIDFWKGSMTLGELSCYAADELTAICRVIVLAVLGSTVEVPAGL